MAEEQIGTHKDFFKDLAPWTKLFVAFKVALDPKKLVLAGAGIFVMALGWYLLAVIFFYANSEKPEWNNKGAYTAVEYGGDANAAWNAFKTARRRWNLLYEMAGPAPESKAAAIQVDAADLADSPEEYQRIEKEKEDITNRLNRLSVKLSKEMLGGVLVIVIDDKEKRKIAVTASKKDETQLEKLLDGKTLEVRDMHIFGEGKNLVIKIRDLQADPVKLEAVQPIREYVDGARTLESIAEEIRTNRRNERIASLALLLHDAPYKPYGRLRTLPWFEDRGPNPYLLLTGEAYALDARGRPEKVAWGDKGFIHWLVKDQLPVLLEPLVKFFRPILYVFDPAAGFWNRIYLFLVILWSLATWAFFGGAITRIAAVQVARTNERVALGEAVKFIMARYKSYLLAPLLPLLFLACFTVGLLFLGFLEGITYAIGDIVFPAIWPLILVAGLIMAVVLVGLVGWPLMYSTISAEGSDSFDAISRSYSYVYQAPWQYLWYSFVALVYGAVLVFFIGLMGSLTIYMSKWAFSLPWTPASREMSYLFQYAPTSCGWRDLLLQKSPNSVLETEVNPRGHLVVVTKYQPNDPENIPNFHNYIGSFLIAVWLYVLFLMVVGFGYSYFWTASTIIYLLMRRKVDDTEMDEIHLEEEPEPAFPTPPTPSPASTGPAPIPMSPAPQMVEAPQLRMPSAPPPDTSHASAPSVSPADASKPDGAAPPTQAH
jgi:hypothetical protein